MRQNCIIRGLAMKNTLIALILALLMPLPSFAVFVQGGEGLETEPNDTLLQADNIPSGITVAGSIGTGQKDIYWFSTNSGLVTISWEIVMRYDWPARVLPLMASHSAWSAESRG